MLLYSLLAVAPTLAVSKKLIAGIVIVVLIVVVGGAYLYNRTRARSV